MSPGGLTSLPLGFTVCAALVLLLFDEPPPQPATTAAAISAVAAIGVRAFIGAPVARKFIAGDRRSGASALSPGQVNARSKLLNRVRGRATVRRVEQSQILLVED